jgi:hypothetical protein
MWIQHITTIDWSRPNKNILSTIYGLVLEKKDNYLLSFKNLKKNKKKLTVAQSLVFCVVFSGPLFIYFFLLVKLQFLSIDLWILIIHLWSDWISKWLLFNAKSAIFQPYHDENKLHFNEKMMMSTLYWIITLFFSFLCNVLCIIVCPFVLFLLTIVLSVLDWWLLVFSIMRQHSSYFRPLH